MAIAKMHHFKLYSMKSLREELLAFMQDFGNIHIKDQSENSVLLEQGLTYVSEPEAIVDIREELVRIEHAMAVLEKEEDKPGGLEALKKGNENLSFQELMERGEKTSVEGILSEVHEAEEKLKQKTEEISALAEEMKEMKPWKELKLSAKELENTAQMTYLTGQILSTQLPFFMEAVEDLDYTFAEEVGTADKYSCLLVVYHREDGKRIGEIMRKYSFVNKEMKFDRPPALMMEEITQKQTQAREEREEIHQELRGLSKHLEEIRIRYEYLRQMEKRFSTNNNLLSTRHVSYIDGYLESSEAERFAQELEEKFPESFYLEIAPAAKDDPDVPIVLKNKKFIRPFESLTKMYAVPRYNELDPTPFLAPFYWVFFGMMIGDLGYGLLLLIGTSIVRRFNLNKSTRDTMDFFFYLSFSAILWGIIFGSFFGGILDLPALVDPAEDYMTVMEISILLGGIHMFLGLGIQGYLLIKNASVMDAVYDVLTWYMTLLGAIYWGLSSIMGLPGGEIAKYVMIIGMVGVVLFTGRDAKSFFGRIASGAYNLYGISSWLGDFISYLRLMALGLSGAFIGVAVNMIASTVAGGGIGGIIGAAAIFLFGQALNFGLSMLSAYVHDLRLTFVEFFGKFYEGGGVPFEGMRSETKYVNLRNKREE